MQETETRPNVLFHYTSLESLLSILNGIDVQNEMLHLWATHIAYLNDMTEGELLPSVLQQLWINRNTIDTLQGCDGYPFVLSLSELNDDLYMWNSYAQQGKGVALGFDFNTLNNIEESSLCKCKYVSIDELCEELKRKNIENLIDQEDSLPLSRLLYTYTHIYKHSSFRAETEWRLVMHGVEDGFRMGQIGLIPYKIIKIPTLALVSITLGPKVDFLHNSFAIERLLKSKFSSTISPEIKRSQIPLV